MRATFVIAAAAFLLACMAGTTYAADGTWISTVNNSDWSPGTNWLNGIKPQYSGDTAYFNTLDLTAGLTVTTNDRTIGNLYFGDTGSANGLFGWKLAGLSGTRTLTLSVGSGSPTISAAAVSGSNLPSRLDATLLLAGNQGFTKAGLGDLRLVEAGAGNTITGNIIVSAGNLVLAGSGTSSMITTGMFADTATRTFQVNSGATLSVADVYSGGDAGGGQYVLGTNCAVVLGSDASPGGTLNFAITGTYGGSNYNYLNNVTMTGGTISATSVYGFRAAYGGNATFTINASSGGSTISAPIKLTKGGGSTATFDVADGAAANDLTISGLISDSTDSGSYVNDKKGAGTMVFNTNPTYAGTTVVDGGVLSLNVTGSSSGGVLSHTSDVTVNSGGTLLVNQFNALGGYAPAVIPTVTVKTGGVLTMATGLNSGVRGLVLEGGELARQGTDDANFGSWQMEGDLTAGVASANTSTISATGVQLIKSGGNTFTVGDGSTLNVTGTIGGTATYKGGSALIKAGNGTMVLNAKESYPGATSVNGGTLELNAAGTYTAGVLTSSSGVTINNGGTILVSQANALGGYSSGANGNIAPAPAVTINTGGLLTSAAGLSNWVGSLTLMGGELGNIGAPDAFYGGWHLNKNVAVGGGTTSTISATHMGLDKSGGVTFTVDGDSTLNVTGSFTTTSGGAEGLAGLIKAGNGAMILAGTNTYTGSTTVNAGSLTLASTGSLLMDVNPTDAFTQLLGNGTLDLEGALKLDVADVAGHSGSWLLVDVGNLIETFGLTFSVKMADGSAFTDLAHVWSYVDSASRRWTFAESSGMLSVANVPEPGTLALLTAGLIGLIAYGWRKRR